MKYPLILLLALFTTITAFSQNFEGEIVYANAYKSKTPNVTDQQFTAMLGSKQECYFKGSQYMSVVNGQLVQWQIFRSQDNKIYTKMANSETAIWNDVTVNDDMILKAEVKKNVAEVLGYKCDELTLTCKNGVQKYYYSSKVPVNPTLFVNHKYGNWYEMLKLTKAMPLKMIIDSPQFSLESVATLVKPMKVEDKIFELPVGMQTQKSPY